MSLPGRWIKHGFVWRASHVADWWDVGTMAPAPVVLGDGRIRVFVGSWKTDGSHPVSRIGYVDVAEDNPAQVLGVSDKPVADIGAPGTYNDSGVFPSHALRLADGRIFLYTTGFQHSVYPEVDHLHTSGLLYSEDNGDTFTPLSLAPVLDRANEGLHIRAGLSAWADEDKGGFHCVYAAGTGFHRVDGKQRVHYSVFYQQSPDGVTFARQGRNIIGVVPGDRDRSWGRPQLTRLPGGMWVVVAAVRLPNQRHHLGCAYSADLQTWTKDENWLASVKHGEPGEFDDKTVYYPALCFAGRRLWLFYSGNGYGRDGFGYAEWLPN